MSVLPVHVVDVIAVLYRFVAAIRPVLVSMRLMHGMRGLTAFVPVPVMGVVNVSVVQVIDVVAVLDRRMPAVRRMLMRVAAVDLMLSRHI